MLFSFTKSNINKVEIFTEKLENNLKQNQKKGNHQNEAISRVLPSQIDFLHINKPKKNVKTYHKDIN